jgi:hypothetical protein
MAKREGAYTIMITGTGPHDNSALNDADQIAGRCVTDLLNAGHTLTSAYVSTSYRTQHMSLARMAFPADGRGGVPTVHHAGEPMPQGLLLPPKPPTPPVVAPVAKAGLTTDKAKA